MLTNITADHQVQFEAITSGHPGMALFSCFVNGEPTAAIVSVTKKPSGYDLHPLFVAVTPSMILTDHDGEEPK